MKYTATAMASAGMVAVANAHGFITKPAARMPGDAMQAACGMQVYYNQMGDNYGNVQGELQVAATQSDYDEAACNIWMCKGYKYADNKDNVQSYTVGEEIPITVDIRAPHTGVANVSIVSTKTNKMISSELKSWDEYASVSSTIPEGQKEFSITMPDVGGECSEAGACVIQWYWNAAEIDQTYESCIDFTVSGSGSGSVEPVATTSAPAKTAVATSASSTTQEVASTCACTNEKRDALAQAAYCQASTTTVTSVSTSAVTETVTISKEVTVTATMTMTASATASATDVDAVADSTTSRCTTSITLTRSSGSILSPVATGTGAPFPFPGATNTTAMPTAPSVSLAPVYSSALANITSALNSDALTSIIPSASVNPILSSYMANITAALPTGVMPTGTAPTALPSGYASATAAPVAGEAAPPAYGSDEAPAEGMTLKQILDWIAYLIKGVFQDAKEAEEKTTPVEPETPAAYSKRSHPRAF